MYTDLLGGKPNQLSVVQDSDSAQGNLQNLFTGNINREINHHAHQPADVCTFIWNKHILFFYNRICSNIYRTSKFADIVKSCPPAVYQKIQSMVTLQSNHISRKIKEAPMLQHQDLVTVLLQRVSGSPEYVPTCATTAERRSQDRMPEPVWTFLNLFSPLFLNDPTSPYQSASQLCKHSSYVVFPWQSNRWTHIASFIAL